jgi:hypothetical protein
MFSRISSAWNNFRTSPSGVFTLSIAVLALGSLHFISSFITTHTYFSIPVTKHEGWILVRINGFGYTMYQENINFNDFKPFKYNYLSRSSKIITMIYTSALQESLNDGRIDEKDVSVLTNRDDETTIKNQADQIFSKTNSQSYQGQLVSLKESKFPVCLYVKGIRDGQSSSYLNILKIQSIKKGKVYNQLTNNGKELDTELINRLSDRKEKIQGLCDLKTQASVLE